MNTVIEDNDLKIIKGVELEICSEFKRVCEENNIQYSLGFGTLLGAVRHKGFIPWDDDIDIMMPRKDYDNFLRIAAKEMNPKFEIVNYESNPYMGEPFTKIMMKDTIMQEVFARNTKVPCGVFIDVLPYDNCPDNRILRQIHRFKNYILRKCILIGSNYDFRKSGVKKIVYSFLGIFSHNTKRLKRLYRKNQTKYNKHKTKELVVLGGNYGYMKDVIPSEWFNEYTTIEFEGVEFSCIKKIKEFLAHYYGDYMQLPPKEKQINKHTVHKLDLTKYGGSKSF